MKKVKKFGQLLYELRQKNGFSLRDVCKKVNYDPSNWSKIERGQISPPIDKETIVNWAKVLGIHKDKATLEEFNDLAHLAQGIIPEDILVSKNANTFLPAFFRTVRNKKPSKEQIDRLIELIRNA